MKSSLISSCVLPAFQIVANTVSIPFTSTHFNPFFVFLVNILVLFENFLWSCRLNFHENVLIVLVWGIICIYLIFCVWNVLRSTFRFKMLYAPLICKFDQSYSWELNSLQKIDKFKILSNWQIRCLLKDRLTNRLKIHWTLISSWFPKTISSAIEFTSF